MRSSQIRAPLAAIVVAGAALCTGSASHSIQAQDASPDDVGNAWTVLVYGGSDNSSEVSFCPDMLSLMQGLDADGEAAGSVEVLCFVDRSPRFTDDARAFGSNFSDSRYFRLTPEGAQALDSGTEAKRERNSGAAQTLGEAIRWAKRVAPAEHMALVFYSHGNGVNWCPDDTDGDALYPAELTDVLSEQEAVDLIVFDVCNMAGVENAYQWRPGQGGFSTDIVVATPMAGMPFPWRRIFARIRAEAAPEGAPVNLHPRHMSAADFGCLVVEETHRERRQDLERGGHGPDMLDAMGRDAMACLDLSRAESVKRAVDALAVGLAAWEDGPFLLDALVADPVVAQVPRYGNPHMNQVLEMGYVDLYALADSLATIADTPDGVRALARLLREAVDAMVLSSYGMDHYQGTGGFQAGKHGLSIVFPASGSGTSRDPVRRWAVYTWLQPERIEATGPREQYGNYAWCRDGATFGDGVVQTWFELLDAWFDEKEAGGVNGIDP